MLLAQKEKEEREAARKAISFGTFAARWLMTRTNTKGEPLRVRTREEYVRLLRAKGTKNEHDPDGPLASFLGLNIGVITPEVVRGWRAEEIARGTRTQTARSYDLMKSILKTAVLDKLIDENPCNIRGGSLTSSGKIVEPPTDEELEKLLEVIDERYRAIAVIAGMGGLRWGEASELRAKDVTVEHDDDGVLVLVRLRVSRQVIRSQEHGRQVGEVKALASVREVAIFGDDAQIIADQVLNKTGDALVTTNADGTDWLPQTSFYRHWDKARKAIERADMPFHALRHYAGTRYAQAGATVKETMTRLGHSTSSAALRYQHAGNRDDELAARMSRNVMA